MSIEHPLPDAERTARQAAAEAQVLDGDRRSPDCGAPPHLQPLLPIVVLDTNVVFDWLLFAHPSCAPLRVAIERRQVRWIATPQMIDECFHVISRGTLDAWAPDTAAMRAAWHAHCSIVATPVAGSFPAAPRCNDLDDQMFIDLAVARRACWLLSKDRAVLRLAARLTPLGVRSISPAAWAQQGAPAVDPDSHSASV